MYSYQGQEEVQKPEWEHTWCIWEAVRWSLSQSEQRRVFGALISMAVKRGIMEGTVSKENVSVNVCDSFMLLISHQTLHLAIQRPLHLNFWKDWVVNRVIIQIPESKDGVQRSSLVGLSHWDTVTGNQREPGYRKYTQLT